MSTSLKGRVGNGSANYNDVTTTSTTEKTGLDVNVVGGDLSVNTELDPTSAQAIADTAQNTADALVQLQNAVTGLTDILAELQLKADATEKQPVGELHTLVPEEHDQITITSYNTNDDPLIVEYRNGGTLVATLTLTYDASFRLIDVVRT